MPDSSVAAEDHPNLLAGLIARQQLQAEIGRGWRTILRWEHQGLPCVVIGNLKRYPIDRVREWILSHERGREVPRRGRPRKTI